MFQTSYALLTGAGENNLHEESTGFYGPGKIGLETVPGLSPGAGEAVIRVTLTQAARRNSYCLELSGRANRLPQVTCTIEDQLWAAAFRFYRPRPWGHLLIQPS
jgi:hypothetical protein